MKAIHLPTVTTIEIPAEYSWDDECIEIYLSQYAWIYCLRNCDNRTKVAWLNSSKSDRDSMFIFNRYEFSLFE